MKEVFTLAISLSLSLLYASPSLAQSDASSPASDAPPQAVASSTPTVLPGPSPMELNLAALELRLFAETHNRESPSLRLDRIENFIYGSTTSGSVEDRYKHLDSALRQKSPDGADPAPLVVPTAAPKISMATPTLQTTVQKTEAEPVVARPLHLALSDIGKVDYDPHKLIQAISVAIAQDPIFTADLFFHRAQADIALKDYKAALKDLEDAIIKEPMRYQYYLARACVYRKLGNPILADKDIATARFSYKDLPEQIEFDKDTEPSR